MGSAIVRLLATRWKYMYMCYSVTHMRSDTNRYYAFHHMKITIDEGVIIYLTHLAEIFSGNKKSVVGAARLTA